MNDLNGEVVNLFRILQRHLPQLLEVMRFQVSSRKEFDRLRQCDPTTLTDLERAARFLYLQRLAFGGHAGGVFGVSPATGPRFSLSKIEPLLEAAHERLDGVVFENLDWSEVLLRWDGPSSLVYLDPPYWGNENDYGKDLFDRSQFQKMSDLLISMKGAFILSINDRPEVRKMFDWANCEGVNLKYTVSKAGATDAAELLISNREIPTSLL